MPMPVFTSKYFASAAAGGTDWRSTAKNVLELLESVRTQDDGFNFGFIYVSDHLSEDAVSIINLFRSVLRIENWIGSIGMGVIGCGKCYVGQPAISALIGKFPINEFCIFPATQEDGGQEQDEVKNWLEQKDPMLIYVHADPLADQDPTSVLSYLESATNGFVVGGITSSRKDHYQFANNICENTVSGAFFSSSIPVATSLSQGCEPISAMHTITKAKETYIFELDGKKALGVFQDDLRDDASKYLKKSKSTFITELKDIESSEDIPEEFQSLFRGEIHVAFPVSLSDQKDYMVRNIIGVDPNEGAIAVSQSVSNGDRVLFVRRDEKSVFKDLSKSLLSLRERIKAEYGVFEPKAALYVSCVARGFSENNQDVDQEMLLVREIIGDVPLAGFYAAGEIHNARLYGYTGILTLFL